MVHVVIAGLRFGLTSCRLAKAAKNRAKLAAYVQNASEALETSDKLMWKLSLSHPDFDQMMALSERLKFELESLRAK